MIENLKDWRKHEMKIRHDKSSSSNRMEFEACKKTSLVSKERLSRPTLKQAGVKPMTTPTNMIKHGSLFYKNHD